VAISKIIILYGGTSSEREVSLESGAYIYQSIKDLGHEVVLLDYPDEFSLTSLQEDDFIFIALHGADGESGALQQTLQGKKIFYSGSNFQACRNTWNKNTCKKLLQENNILTPKWASVSSLYEIKNGLNDPLFDELRPFNSLFLKPEEDGSSIDVFKIKGEDDLQDAIQTSANPDRPFIFEECVDYKELTVPILNGKCLPAVQIKTSESFYNFDAKYINDDTQLSELELSEIAKKKLEQICLKTFKVMGCEGWARIDLLQDQKGNFYVMEINTVPGMTSHSLFPKSASSFGLSYNDLVQQIVQSK
jgi:D-alanine-D-alanine ligase